MPETIRVTEIDSERITRLEAAVEQIKGAQIEQGHQITKTDEAIRGNGKEGLNSIVRRTEEKLDALLGTIEKMIERQVGAAIEKLNHDLSGKINTHRMRAITREEIQAYNKETEAGSWPEFRRTWLFPIVMMVISALMSAGLTYLIISP